MQSEYHYINILLSIFSSERSETDMEKELELISMADVAEEEVSG